MVQPTEEAYCEPRGDCHRCGKIMGDNGICVFDLQGIVIDVWDNGQHALIMWNHQFPFGWTSDEHRTKIKILEHA